jgi:DNA-directed RNA polymerase specialized sigma24 family protein
VAASTRWARRAGHPADAAIVGDPESSESAEAPHPDSDPERRSAVACPQAGAPWTDAPAQEAIMRSDSGPPALVPTPAQAADLERLAAAAGAGSAEARNDLFAALAGPIGQAVARRRSLCSFLERDEVTSETFLALADLLDCWPGDDFAAAFARLYGRCLTRRLARWRRPGRDAEPLPPEELPSPDGEAALARAIAELPTDLTATERWLLEQKVAGASMAGLARELGVSPRTVDRHWRALALRLRGSLSPPAATAAPAPLERRSGLV